MFAFTDQTQPSPRSTATASQHGPALAVRGLVKRYGAVTAVGGIDLTVESGTIVGLLGPNGAGKTSVIECIVGLRRPDGGSIQVVGIDAVAHPRRAAQVLGAQLQATALQDAITVNEAIALFRSFHATGAEPAALLAEVGLTGLGARRFATLSHGQRQSLALALALVHDPAALVLDETTAGLDPAARRTVHDVLRQRARAGTAILLATQHIDEAERLCDRVVVVDGGRIIADGSPAALIAESCLPTRVVLRTRWPLPGISAQIGSADAVTTIATTDVTRTLSATLSLLTMSGNELFDVRIERPTLEDVFLARTGRPISGEASRAEAPCVD